MSSTNIVVLEDSPNRNGASNFPAEQFVIGARESGHNVQIWAEILRADMMVFVTPLYYYGMTAQLKTLIDRFCAFNSSIQQKHMKSALLAVAWNSDNWTFNALKAHYKTLIRYL